MVKPNPTPDAEPILLCSLCGQFIHIEEPSSICPCLHPSTSIHSWGYMPFPWQHPPVPLRPNMSRNDAQLDAFATYSRCPAPTLGANMGVGLTLTNTAKPEAEVVDGCITSVLDWTLELLLVSVTDFEGWVWRVRRCGSGDGQVVRAVHHFSSDSITTASSRWIRDLRLPDHASARLWVLHSGAWSEVK